MLNAWIIGAALKFAAEDAIAEMGRASASFARLEKSAEQAKKGIGSLNEAAMGLTIAAAPIAMLFKSGIAAAAEFEDAMAGVASKMSGAERASGGLATLAKQAKLLGAQSRFSATEIAQGQELVKAAGFEQNEVLQAMPGIVSLASIENMKLADASSIVSNILRGMGESAGEAARIVDILAVASNETNTSAKQLGEAFSYAQGAGRLMGLTTEELASALGVISNAGYQGSIAGTSFGQMLQRLAPRTKKAKEEMRKFGVDYAAIFQKARKTGENPIVVLVHSLNAALKKQGLLVDDKIVDRAEKLTRVFGTEGLRALQALRAGITGSEDALISLTNKTQNAKDAANQMAAVRMDSFVGAMTRLKASITGAAIEFFGPVLAAATPLVLGLAKSIGNVVAGVLMLRSHKPGEFMPPEWADLSERTRDTAQGFSAAIDWMVARIVTLRRVATEAGERIADAMSKATVQQVVKVATFVAVLAPLGVAVTAIGFIVNSVLVPAFTGLMLVASSVGNVFSGLLGIMSVAKDVFLAVAWFFGGPVSILAGFVAFVAIAGTVGIVFEMIRQGFNSIVVAMTEFSSGFMSGLMPVWDTLKEVFASTMQTISESVSRIFAFFNEGAQGTRNDWLSIGQTVGAVIGAIISGLATMVGWGVQAFTFLTEVIIKTITTAVSPLWQFFVGITDLLKQIGSGVIDMFAGNWEKGFRRIGIAIIDFLLQPLKAALRLAINAADAFGQGKLVPQAARDFVSKDLAGDLFPRVPEEPNKPSDAFKRIVENDRMAKAAMKPAVAVTVPPQAPPSIVLNNNTQVKLGNKDISAAAAKHNLEVMERSGATNTPWHRIVMLENGGFPVRGF